MITLFVAKIKINIMQITTGIPFILKSIYVVICTMETYVIVIITLRKITGSITRPHFLDNVALVISSHENV